MYSTHTCIQLCCLPCYLYLHIFWDTYEYKKWTPVGYHFNIIDFNYMGKKNIGKAKINRLSHITLNFKNSMWNEAFYLFFFIVSFMSLLKFSTYFLSPLVLISIFNKITMHFTSKSNTLSSVHWIVLCKGVCHPKFLAKLPPMWHFYMYYWIFLRSFSTTKKSGKRRKSHSSKTQKVIRLKKMCISIANMAWCERQSYLFSEELS